MEIEDKIATPNFDSIMPQVCVNAKLRKLHRLINAQYQKKINAFGLRGSMLSILFIIGKRPGIGQKPIADALVLDQSTMSRDLKKLIDKGLIQKTKGNDTRQSVLKLTNKGYQLLEEIVPVWQELQSKIETLLGQFQIQQIDTITRAVLDYKSF